MKFRNLFLTLVAAAVLAVPQSSFAQKPVHPVAAVKAAVKIPKAVTNAAASVLKVPYALLAPAENNPNLEPFTIDPSKQTQVKPDVTLQPSQSTIVPVAVLPSGSSLNPTQATKYITQEDVDRYFTAEGGVPYKEVSIHPRFYEVLNAEFAWQTGAGLNPALVSPADFDYKAFNWGIAGVQVIVKHLGTGKSTLTDLRYVLSYGAYPLVVDLTAHLAK